ncbi:unnamed protein product, partial [marine sediment metagenome]
PIPKNLTGDGSLAFFIKACYIIIITYHNEKFYSGEGDIFAQTKKKIQ